MIQLVLEDDGFECFSGYLQRLTLQSERPHGDALGPADVAGVLRHAEAAFAEKLLAFTRDDLRVEENEPALSRGRMAQTPGGVHNDDPKRRADLRRSDADPRR